MITLACVRAELWLGCFFVRIELAHFLSLLGMLTHMQQLLALKQRQQQQQQQRCDVNLMDTSGSNTCGNKELRGDDNKIARDFADELCRQNGESIGLCVMIHANP